MMSAVVLGVRVQFWASDEGDSQAEVPPIVFTEPGILVGDSAARAFIVEFVDFECRYCGRMQRLLDDIVTMHAPQIAVIYRHYPLSPMGYSLPAALAAECAFTAGRFTAVAGELFQSQDTLDRVDFAELAYAAGIEDTTTFRACREDPDTRTRVFADVKLGRQLGVTSTPTFVIGGRLIPGEIAPDRLRGMIDHLLEEARSDSAGRF
jgi:protein-disulfide isomerase